MINLLPFQYKKELKKEKTFKSVLIFGIIFLSFLISLVLNLFLIKIDIRNKSDSLKLLVDAEEKILEDSEFRKLQQKIISINEKISKLESFYKTNTDSTIVLKKISQILPSGIYLTSFFWQKETNKVVLSGFSSSRKILSDFKNNLEKEKDFFSKIYFPPQTWTKQKDIFFQITFNININRKYEF